MNRKEFLVQLTGYGAATAGLAAFAPCCSAAAEVSADGTPIDKRMSFAQTYIKRFMDAVDHECDEATRIRLMHANGKACFIGSGAKPFPGGLDAFIEEAKKWVAPNPPFIRREGDIVYFDYVQNPAGLKVKDGWCLCPLVEKGPPGLSGTFCECSVGYVTQMFTDLTGKPVRVELLESLKRGGKGCRFRINLA